MSPAIVRKLTVYPLRIPMRGAVEHAGARRDEADPIVVGVELAGGTWGFGETLPRPYVTGESRQDALDFIQTGLLSAIMSFNAPTFAEALEGIEALPCEGATSAGPATEARAEPGGRASGAALQPGPIESARRHASRTAVELALLDACMKHFHRGVGHVVGWMGLPVTGPRSGAAGRFPAGHVSREPLQPGRRPRGSAVLASADVGRLRKKLRLYRFAGFRDFKLKVGFDRDEERAELVRRSLGRALCSGRAALRLDVNGGWSSKDGARELGLWSEIPLAGIEQPLARGQEAELAGLRRFTNAPWIHDESLIDVEDARRLIGLGVADVFNVRLSKCGGFLPALRLALLARREGVRVQLGCMVGETSILAAAGLRFLEAFPHAEWVEGCFGTWLLRTDVVRKSLRLGYGGRLPEVSGPGWGVQVDAGRLTALSDPAPIVLHLG
ncbi:MAG: N-succinyl-L-Arg/Lys racemase [Phycisphaerae bacterium]|nr:N-succinyl-L-Arg/Lys racemase [Phycisphaerae bacterium]